jgi:hypothetical protein
MSLLPRRRAALALAALGIAWLLPLDVGAKPRGPKIRWTIVLPERKDAPRVAAMLKAILEKETRKARWGSGFPLEAEATIDIRELSARIDGDIVRVSCAALGKMRELGVARTRFSYGGKAVQQAQLEKHILELVARGIIVRLAELAREKFGGWKVTR